MFLHFDFLFHVIVFYFRLGSFFFSDFPTKIQKKNGNKKILFLSICSTVNKNVSTTFFLSLFYVHCIRLSRTMTVYKKKCSQRR
jgi:hypothetical protein